MFWQSNLKISQLESELSAARSSNESLYRENARLSDRVAELEARIDAMTNERNSDFRRLVDRALEDGGRNPLFRDPPSPVDTSDMPGADLRTPSFRRDNIRRFASRHVVSDALANNLGIRPAEPKEPSDADTGTSAAS